MKPHHVLAIAMAVVAATAPARAGKEPPPGILAASVGDQVVLVEVSSGLSAALATGPVGWLFPAPGGILFAPDTINGRTTVINLRTQTAVDRIDGLTMPHFGDSPDRYIALAGEIMLVSYPERAVLATMPTRIAHPWQVVITPDDAAMLALERLPDAADGVHMTMVNLITRRVVSRRPLAGDVVHFALSTPLGLVALADAGADRVHLVDPATLTQVADHVVEGRPQDVAFARKDKVLATALATADDGGLLDLAVLKRGKKGLRVDKRFSLELAAAPVRLARSPDGGWLAVALATGAVVIVNLDNREVVADYELPAAPRDLRWCDPTLPGPVLPEWTDDEPAGLEFSPFEPPPTQRLPDGGETP